jgi:hypothetical protein
MPSPLSFPEKFGPVRKVEMVERIDPSTGERVFRASHTITTNETVRNDLKQSLQLRDPAYAGETVGEFVDALLRLVGRDEHLGSVQWNVAAHGMGRLRIEREDGSVHIFERVSHAS